MHSDLEAAFHKVIAILQEDPRCKGGWHYGSIGRGDDDEYSDYDPVFLVSDQDFETFATDVPHILSEASDELLIFWGESFNDAHFKNFCSIITIGSNLHQFDFFMMNEAYPEDWMCRQHLKGCSPQNIIFDKTGEVTELLQRGYRTDNHTPDIMTVMDTYWFHTVMLVKYFLRKDLFKLIKNIDILFHAHVDLLLSKYDTLDWGAWDSKVKHCVPSHKQEHLKAYFTKANEADLKQAIKQSMLLFQQDAEEICLIKGIQYSQHISEQAISYFNRKVDMNN